MKRLIIPVMTCTITRFAREDNALRGDRRKPRSLGCRLGRNGERLTNEQFHRYRATAGQLTAKGLADLMATQAWRSMDDEKQRKAFDDMKADSRKAARETLGLIEKMKSAPRKKRARSASSVPASSPPGAMPALPPGFALEP